MIELIDSHVHLDSKDFEPDLDQVIKRACDAGISKFVSIGAGSSSGAALQSARNVVALCDHYPMVWGSCGVHPHNSNDDFDISELRELASHKKIVAIGETGLDFYRDWSPKEAQEKAFRSQINLALELRLPLIIHSREAGPACLKILIESGAKEVGGVFHCYAEDAAFADQLAAINFLVSFPGAVTFKKATALRETVRAIALEQMMIETDAPYLAPEPYRGKRCESAFMLETAKVIAAIKNITLQEFAKIVTATTNNFFKLN